VPGRIGIAQLAAGQTIPGLAEQADRMLGNLVSAQRFEQASRDAIAFYRAMQVVPKRMLRIAAGRDRIEFGAHLGKLEARILHLRQARLAPVPAREELLLHPRRPAHRAEQLDALDCGHQALIEGCEYPQGAEVLANAVCGHGQTIAPDARAFTGLAEMRAIFERGSLGTSLGVDTSHDLAPCGTGIGVDWVGSPDMGRGEFPTSHLSHGVRGLRVPGWRHPGYGNL
jgi:hypothetical protein